MKSDSLKLAVVTLAIGEDYRSIADLTHPLMRSYAKNVGAAFVEIDSEVINAGDVKFEKFQIFDLLDKYDRILYFDADVVISPRCPDIFIEVPPTHVGAFYDSEVTGNDADRPEWRSEEIVFFQAKHGDIGWSKCYFNSGVFVVSRAHKTIFNYADGLSKGKRFVDQTQLNYNAMKGGFLRHDLGPKYNHLAALGRCPKQWASRLNAHVIHYAGFVHVYPEVVLHERIAEDIALLRQQTYTQ